MSHLEAVLADLALGTPTVRPAGIAALGAALPPATVGNDELAERFGVEPAWIVQRTGIEHRRVAAPGTRLADLAATAARRALASAGLEGADVDGVLVATCSPEGFLPPCAPQVARALGAGHAMAWDVGLACTGFVAALQQAAALVEAGRADAVLVIGAEIMSRRIDPADRSTAMLFGDGAGAALVTVGGAARVGETVLGSDGEMAGALDADPETGCMRMDGHTVFRHAVPRMAEACHDVLDRAGRALEDVDLVIAHQANARITRALGLRLGLEDERVVDVIDQTGNTSAASVPLALARAAADGRLPDTGLVLLCAFGAGFAWGASVLELEGTAVAVAGEDAA